MTASASAGEYSSPKKGKAAAGVDNTQDAAAKVANTQAVAAGFANTQAAAAAAAGVANTDGSSSRSNYYSGGHSKSSSS